MGGAGGPSGAGYHVLGSQGDIWDAQKDMAAALFGALNCMILLALSRRLFGRSKRDGLPMKEVAT